MMMFADLVAKTERKSQLYINQIDSRDITVDFVKFVQYFLHFRDSQGMPFFHTI